jgi:hypothetical protein
MFDFQDLSDGLDGLVPDDLLEPLPDLGLDLGDMLGDDSLLAGDAAQIAAVDASDAAFVDGLLSEFGAAGAAELPGAASLDFIDTVMNASPEQLDHISQLEQAGAAHEAQSDLPTPDTLQAEWTSEEAEVEADRREQEAVDDAVAKSRQEELEAWKLEQDVIRDLGIFPTRS